MGEVGDGELVVQIVGERRLRMVEWELIGGSRVSATRGERGGGVRLAERERGERR